MNSSIAEITLLYSLYKVLLSLSTQVENSFYDFILLKHVTGRCFHYCQKYFEDSIQKLGRRAST